MNINICEMNISDLELIKINLENLYDDFWNYDKFKEELSSDYSKYFIAKENDEIVGFFGIKVILDEAEIMNIVTKKSERNKKIASQMMDFLIDYCKQNKIKLINLEVNEENIIAINLYKKYNFKQVGLRKKYYNGTNDAILMSLEL